MYAIIGIVVLLVLVFGGFVISGGAMGPVLHALPYEMMIIGGAGMIIFGLGNDGVAIGISNLWTHGGFFPNGVNGNIRMSAA